MGEKWIVFPNNFDNIFESLMSMFIISTLANWNIIMYNAMDSNSSDYVRFQISIMDFNKPS